jgi:hypothetical protein
MRHVAARAAPVTRDGLRNCVNAARGAELENTRMDASLLRFRLHSALLGAANIRPSAADLLWKRRLVRRVIRRADMCELDPRVALKAELADTAVGVVFGAMLNSALVLGSIGLASHHAPVPLAMLPLLLAIGMWVLLPILAIRHRGGAAGRRAHPRKRPRASAAR